MPALFLCGWKIERQILNLYILSIVNEALHYLLYFVAVEESCDEFDTLIGFSVNTVV